MADRRIASKGPASSDVASVMTNTARMRFDRRTAIYCLLLSTAGAIFGAWAFLCSSRQQVPADVRTVAGEVADVRYSRGRHGAVDVIRFTLDQTPGEFVYSRSYPSFDRAKQCIVSGAGAVVGTSNGVPDIWSLRCEDWFIGPAEFLAARRANGRWAAWIAVTCVAVSAFWSWLLVARRAA